MSISISTPGEGGSATGLVADAINDGTTTVAPSQNAVFDALALKIANPGGANDDFLQRKAGVYTNRTIAQVKTDLGVVTPPTVAPFTISGGSQNFGLPGVIFTATNNVRALSNNRMWYLPFVTYATMAVDRIICEVTTGVAASNIRMGIYAADTAWQPTGAAISGSDTGDISAASAAVKTGTVSATLPPGRYLVAIVADTAGISVRATVMMPTWGTEITSSAFVGGTASIIQGVFRTLSKTYASAFSTATPIDSVVSSSAQAAGDWPFIVLRWT